MANHRNRFPGRRRFLKQSTALTATVVALPLPRLTGAQQPAPTEEKKTGDDEFAMLRVLARYCGSTALTLSMHTHVLSSAVWRWQRDPNGT